MIFYFYEIKFKPPDRSINFLFCSTNFLLNDMELFFSKNIGRKICEYDVLVVKLNNQDSKEFIFNHFLI